MAHGKRRRDSIHETPDVSYITNPDVAHEESDVAVRPLLWFVGGLPAFTLLTCPGCARVLKFVRAGGGGWGGGRAPAGATGGGAPAARAAAPARARLGGG